MDRYEREGKDAVTVGSPVRVKGVKTESDTWLERGWTAKLLELRERAGRSPLATVTNRPKSCGVRFIDADRLTNVRS